MFYKRPRAAAPEARESAPHCLPTPHSQAQRLKTSQNQNSQTSCTFFLLFRQNFLKITSFIPSFPHTDTKNKKFLLSLQFAALLIEDLSPIIWLQMSAVQVLGSA